MDYPASFYFANKQDDWQYSHKPQNHPNIDKLIKGQACWPTIKPATNLKKKTLILAPFFPDYWEKNNQPSMSMVLKQMLDDGFSIYFWKNEQTEALTKEALDNLDRVEMTDKFPNTITKEAIKQHNLTHDEVMVLDDHWLDYLINRKTQRELSITALMTRRSPVKEKILSFLQSATPPVTNICHDTFSTEANKQTAEVKALFPHIPVEASYKNASLTEANVEKIIKKQSINEGGSDFNPETLQHINTLAIETTLKAELIETLFELTPELRRFKCNNGLPGNLAKPPSSEKLVSISIESGELTGNTLAQLLASAPGLEALDVSNCHGLDKPISLTQPLRHLKHLSLHRTKIDLNTLEQLLDGATQLESLWLYNFLTFNGHLALKATFAHLRTLNASLSNISIPDLEAFLLKTPMLHTLSLNRCNSLNKPFTETKLPLSKLEKLDLSNSTISAINLETLLINAPALNVLNLTKCEALTETFSQHSIHLPRLTQLDASDSQLNSTHLETLLKNAQLLITLDLNGCQKLNGAFTEAVNLPCLNELRASGSTISSDCLSAILTKAKQIEMLQLDDCKNLFEPFTNTTNLAHLKTLHLNGSNISSLNLVALLTKAQQLEELVLNGCQDLSDAFNKPLALTNLKSLYLRNSNISSSNLKALLCKAKNISELNLSGCNNLSEPFIEHLQNLSSLRNFDASDSNINETSLAALLKEATGLRSINLRGCKHLKATFIKEVELPFLENIDLSCSNISFANLEGLLKKPKKLKRLSLIRCDNLFQSFTNPKALKLENLENLSALNSAISSHNLETLLSHAEKLTHLDVSGAEALSKPFNNKAIRLPNLKELRITTTSVNLESLLSHAKTLEKLSISGDLSVAFSKAVVLPCLRELSAHRSNISATNLRNLLSHSSMIQKLNLAYWNNFSASFVMDLYLPELEELDLSFSNINHEDLRKLILNSPKLKTVNITNCKNLRADDSLEKLIKERNIQVDRGTDHGLMAEDREGQQARAPQSLTSEEYVDANTGEDDNPLEVTRYFKWIDGKKNQHPDFSDYRLAAFNRVEINASPCAPNNAFRIHNTQDKPLKPCSLTVVDDVMAVGNALLAKSGKNQSKDLFLGSQRIRLTNDWQALASLSFSEQLTHYSTHPKHAIEIKYSEQDNLYYVRSLENYHQVIDIEFLLQIDSKPTEPSLPQDIIDLVNTIASFKSGPLQEDTENPSGNDYLRYLIEQKKGACRHRTLVFKASMQTKYPDYPVRIINNDCHSFVEIQVSGKWVKRDLGGFPAKLVIRESRNIVENTTLLDDDTPVYHDDSISTHQSIPKPSKEKVSQEDIKRFTSHLKTWKKATSSATSVLAYCQHLNQGGATKKRLIELTDSKNLHSLRFNLQTYCQSISRPFFYVNSPDDLVCSAPFIERTGNQGKLHSGPGGALHDFLQAHQDKSNPPLLLVNYDNFDASDIVRFNGLLDKERHADNSPLPTESLVLGLININKPDAYQGADFYSRFDTVETCPLNSETLNQKLLPLPIIEQENTNKTACIYLYHAPDWESRLLGHWSINGQQLHFVEGELEKALQTGLPITLHHAPWENVAFQQFWQEALIRGHIDYQGHQINLPKNFQIIKKEGYDWQALTTKITWKSGLTQYQDHVKVLNATSLGDFFRRFTCHEGTQTLETLPGWLEGQKTLDINLTGPLNEDEWAMLLTVCQQKKIALTIHCAPSVTFPDAVRPGYQPLPRKYLNDNPSRKTRVIVSSDTDTSLNQLMDNQQAWQVIDVLECTADDLLLRTRSEMKQENFSFLQSEGALLTALNDNKQIILKGGFSEELANELAPLLLARQNDPNASGQLVLLMDKDRFNYLPAHYQAIQAADKQICLKKNFSPATILRLEPGLLSNEPLSRLHARLNYLNSHPNASSSDEAWAGIHQLSNHMDWDNNDLSLAAANAFNQQRLDAVNHHLLHSPYVLLTGLTGVGKSTFVEKELSKENKLHHGFGNLLAWATDTTKQQKLLFIDEANLSNQQWSEFEGLFNNPPGILIDGKHYPLTPQHKVIFAANPLSYGDARSLPSLFQRHGNALVFEPLTNPFIVNYLLEPVFANTDLANRGNEVVKPILDVYRFLCERSEKEVLISPRELQMMALLIVSSQNPESASHYAYQLARHLVPEQYLSEFEQQFKPEDLKSAEPIVPHSMNNDFLITPSRKAIHQQLHELLTLCDFKRTKATNDAQRYGGLGGIVLEGDPGIGKSELVVQTLLAHGYQEEHCTIINGEKTDHKIRFYRIPVSMQPDDKKRLLLQAFDQGAAVIMDEINSSPMMEALLNDLLMGKTPDKKPPQHPGFILIGTQNPVTMAGRRKPSTALARRLMTNTLEPYPHDEMISILMAKGLSDAKAKALVTAYEINHNRARRQQFLPEPTFRDLLKYADDVLRSEPASTKAAVAIPIKCKAKAPVRPTKPIAPATKPLDTKDDEVPHQTTSNNQNAEPITLRQALLIATNNYLNWRQNKTIDDKRGYKHGFFTKLRHYSAFGENRANGLKDQLTALPADASLSDVLWLLKQHLKQDSKLHNHSLDTYLLEAVMEHKNELDFTLPVENLRNQNNRQALRLAILENRPVEAQIFKGH